MGRVTAIIYNNLGVEIRNFQGPAAALDVLEEGLRFSEARGLQDGALAVRTSALPALLASGDLEGVLEATRRPGGAGRTGGRRVRPDGDPGEPGERARARGPTARCREVSGVAGRGLPSDRPRGLHRREPDRAATVRIALGQEEEARALLSAIESTPGLRRLGRDRRRAAGHRASGARARRDRSWPNGSPVISHRGIPTRSIPWSPSAPRLRRRMATTGAAASAYPDAAARWEGFGVVIEEAFARLGQGRCLLAFSRPGRSVRGATAGPGDLRPLRDDPRAPGDGHPARQGHRPQFLTRHRRAAHRRPRVRSARAGMPSRDPLDRRGARRGYRPRSRPRRAAPSRPEQPRREHAVEAVRLRPWCRRARPGARQRVRSHRRDGSGHPPLRRVSTS